MTLRWRPEYVLSSYYSPAREDRRFQAAMRAAAALGLEHPPMIGIARDPRPLGPATHIANLPQPSSYASSPAQLLADLGRTA